MSKKKEMKSKSSTSNKLNKNYNDVEVSDETTTTDDTSEKDNCSSCRKNCH